MLKKMPPWSVAVLYWAWPRDGSLEGATRTSISSILSESFASVDSGVLVMT